MYGFLRSGRWAVATTVVLGLAILFVNLGLWQLRRHDQRMVDNQVMSARLASAPVEVGSLLDAVGDDLESVEYQPVTATGTYRTDLERLTRNQTHQGTAGYHVLTPLELDSGALLVVNRGWVPLEHDSPPVAQAPPPGRVTVEGVARATQTRSAVGPVDPADALVLSRIDLAFLQDQLGATLVPVWLQAEGPAGSLPVPVPLEDFDDPGSHFGYAIQWFSFALIAVVGFAALVRSTARRGSGRVRR